MRRPRPIGAENGKAAARGAKPKTRTNDPDRTKANILEIATHEFSEKGLSGARIDEIAERTRTSKRMIYYYFESKEGLYRAVLEDAYRRIRAIERSLDLEHKPPLEALAQHVRFTFDHQLGNEDFIRLVMVENIHRGEHIARLPELVAINGPAVRLLARLLSRGRETGEFRDDVDAVDVHLMISAFCFFRVANQHTFGTLFGRDLLDPARRAHYRTMLSDMVVAHLTST